MLTLAHSPRGSAVKAARSLNTEVTSRSATTNGDISYSTKVHAPRTQSGILANTGEPAWFDVPTEEKLIMAVDRGDLQKVRNMLAAGVSAETTARGGQSTVLMMACERGYGEIARELILHGADVNSETRAFGFTALMSAAVFGEADIVTMLLDAGADVDHKTFATNAVCAVDLARKHGNVEVVRRLLMAGADLPELYDAAQVLTMAEEVRRRKVGEGEDGPPMQTNFLCGMCFLPRQVPAPQPALKE